MHVDATMYAANVSAHSVRRTYGRDLDHGPRRLAAVMHVRKEDAEAAGERLLVTAAGAGLTGGAAVIGF